MSIFGHLRLLTLCAACVLISTTGWSANTPTPKITIRVDVRNVIAANGSGALPLSHLRSWIGAASTIWEQCGLSFLPRTLNNVNAEHLGIPYRPSRQADLSQLAKVLNPDGFLGALPVTIAGPWNFQDPPGSGWFLHGLGWQFTKADGTIDRIGAMVGAQHAHNPKSGKLIAHELGHALSLRHSEQIDNLMAGGSLLTSAQCEQSRRFIQAHLDDFVVPLHTAYSSTQHP